MNPQQRRSTVVPARLFALFAAAALTTACGGGGDAAAPAATPTPASVSTPTPPPPPPPPAPAPEPPPPPADTAFATPASASATAESGEIISYSYAATPGDLTAGDTTYASGVVSFSATLAAPQGYAGAALRYYAPSNTGAAPAAPFDASGYSKLKIELASSTDATLSIKLQPNPLSGDGCTATATAIVSATMAELVIDLDSASFPLPGYCTAGTGVEAVKAGLYAIDIVNGAASAGAHDLRVGSVKFSK